MQQATPPMADCGEHKQAKASRDVCLDDAQAARFMLGVLYHPHSFLIICYMA